MWRAAERVSGASDACSAGASHSQRENFSRSEWLATRGKSLCRSGDFFVRLNFWRIWLLRLVGELVGKSLLG